MTRDSARFPLVHNDNIAYGFRRNLLGLKPLGIVIASLALVATVWTVSRGWRTDGVFPPVAVVATLLNFCCVLGWLIGVRASTVRITADRYARSLLEAALDLEVKT